ncbi:forespore capture DNA-binding protein RefZ [Lederbergia wuyishanensis]|uniref:AcrR family transcriptional regulator n=1 Tax=Lederbergia wuyishanensis TaxID=1347903 RepID=A0ABU0D514_9BACI|nr:forespore capture DNA-binding protein RefZ [Lederbergia wuyishanensis]MCJ8009599.1 forespore capture DNA-binding protein RefZ [Lederbergia wuyishanensis]MDQ0343506.1 AcrR family transcriptional regulator [Lederbergia wuyishanensis]
MNTQEAIIEAAIALFNLKGYQGTSIRDIASRAKVNPANISYYFKNKQGLLEECLIYFFEPYLSFLEEETQKLENDSGQLCLIRAIKKVMYFQSKHYQLARFVWREITIDTQTSREMISLYLMKEQYFYSKMIQAASKENKTPLSISMIVIQLKGMLMMPYINNLYVREVWGMIPQEPYFAEKYFNVIKSWLLVLLGSEEQNTSPTIKKLPV